MSPKTLLLLSNGYGEDSFASLLLEKLVQLTRGCKIPSTFLVIPLVGEGAQFYQCRSQYPDLVSVIVPPFSLPNGGVYLGSAWQKSKRFIEDYFRGVLPNSGFILRELKRIKNKIDAVIGIGDFIPPLLNKLFLQKDLYMVACAHTWLLKRSNQPLERLGRLTRHLFRYGCRRVYTRDRLTEQWFLQLGITAEYLGFLGPDIKKEAVNRKKIVFLPGSRKDWKNNLGFFFEAFKETNTQYIKDFEIHLVFSPGVDTQDIQFFLMPLLKNHHFFMTWSQGDYFQHLSQSALVVGFAGTAIEQAAFLGIPSIEPWQENAIQANRDFIENRQKLLLREALIPGGDTPSQLARVLENTLLNIQSYQKAAESFSQKVWEGKSNGGMTIAENIIMSLTNQ
ncbi:hypothetical protein [Atribacter laminatus]|uniref:Uncharacterized protein n=1 Tax=Atribacter laminatus TaxID=2847778 RepID=A0A7T1AJN6_ATRLM|nr:hypothetical protein [Atribacter laminatus]QPM67151.1 hypothetical protein RT761_00343 [Atribacter laminatus]